jgi:curli production assembly/transport component CsgG
MRNTLLSGSAACLLLLGGCAYPIPETLISEPAKIEVKTAASATLRTLPPPQQQLTVAVYKFEDLTGQNRPNTEFPEYSRAVTQGGSSVLVNALEKTGDGRWFDVVERGNLDAILQERQIIRATYDEFGQSEQSPLQPLTFAGLILEGGIIGYDSNTLTGGFGARFLGIGGDVQYRRDTVTVYVRAVAVQTGRVLKSVSTSKTIYSVGLQGGVFKFLDYAELLEIETGLTTNEPVMLATQAAVEKAVYALVIEGLMANRWQLQDPLMAPALIDDYVRERDGFYNVEKTAVTPDQITEPARPSRPAPASDEAPVQRPPSELPPREMETRPGATEPSEGGTTGGPTYIIPSQDGRSPIPGGRVPGIR